MTRNINSSQLLIFNYVGMDHFVVYDYLLLALMAFRLPMVYQSRQWDQVTKNNKLNFLTEVDRMYR